MTTPRDDAFAAFRDRFAARLVEAEVLASVESLADKPIVPHPGQEAPMGGTASVALLLGTVRVRNSFIGGGRAIYQLDVVVLVEFMAADPAKEARETLSGTIETTLSELIDEDPTLGAAVQRTDIDGEPSLIDAPPAFVITTIPVALSIQAADKLGRVAVA